MPYFKYSAFWPDNSRNEIRYYWEVAGGGTESATTTCMFGDKGQTSSSSSCKTKYEKLPQSLKSCLDYCAFLDYISKFYSEGSIEKDKLVRLMVAEGIIEEKAGEGDAFSLEQIASSFIDELIRLEMLIPEFVFTSYEGSITRIKVSEAYYKLCVVEGNCDDFAARNSHSPIRAIVSLHDANDISPCLKNLPIQSLFLFPIFGEPSQAIVDTIRGMRSLLVLDMLEISSNILFNGVGEMVNLRFLRFICSDKFLPTLGNLQNLHTLQLTCWSNVVLEEVMRMKTLRHLFVSSFRLRKGIGGLVNLQTLVGWDARSDVIGELRSLTQMRRLHVRNVVDETINELLEAIMTMKNLISLHMRVQFTYHQESLIQGFQVLPFLEPFSPPPFLQELLLHGILMELPNWFVSMKNLTSLILIGSSLSESPFTILQSIPQLKCLYLENAYNAKLIGKEFCGAGGFPKLEILKIESHALVEWSEIVFGAFPSLTSLSCYCKNLRFFPEGLQNIFSLQELHIAVHGDLIRRLEGDENYKIKHIPSIHISSYVWI